MLYTYIKLSMEKLFKSHLPNLVKMQSGFQQILGQAEEDLFLIKSDIPRKNNQIFIVNQNK